MIRAERPYVKKPRDEILQKFANVMSKCTRLKDTSGPSWKSNMRPCSVEEAKSELKESAARA